MAETRVLAPLLQEVDRAEGKLLLVGDPAQLPAVGAGGLYPALCDRLGAIELHENRRQRDPREREALARLRTGDPEPYLAHAARAGRLAIDEDPLEAKQRLLADWWRDARRDPAGSVMLAYRRSDVDELNEAAHALMRQDGRLGGEAVTLEEREFRPGEHPLPPKRRPPRRPQRHPRHRPRRRRATRSRSETDAGIDRRVRSATPPTTSTTATRSPATPPKAPPSSAPTSSSTTKAPCKNGATSPAAAPASKPASTSPTPTCLERETPLRRPDPAGPPERAARALDRPSPSRSHTTNAQNEATRSSTLSPSNRNSSTAIASARRAAHGRAARAPAPPLVEPRSPRRA